LTIIEPLGIRLFGVEIKETQLNSISNALKETAQEYLPGWHGSAEEMEKIAEVILKFGDLVIEEEKNLLNSNQQALQTLFSRSGAKEYGHFFETFLNNIARRKNVVRMLSDLSGVSIETGSVSIKYRDREGEVEELKINLQKIWKEIRKRAEQIKNSFRHLAELTSGEVKQAIVHIGIYGAAFVLVVFSLWYGMAFSIVSGLSTIASSVVNSLKTCFPLLSIIVWLFCTLIQITEGLPKIHEAYELIKEFLSK